VTRKRARESLITQEEEDNAEVKSQLEIGGGNEPSEPRSVASDKMDSSATSENEVETPASPPATTTHEHPSILSSVHFGDSASSNRENSPETAPGSPMRIDIDIPSGISEQPADSGASDIIMGDDTPPIKNPDDSQLTVRNLQMEITPSKFYRKSYTNRPKLNTQKSQDKMQDMPGEIIVDSYDRQPRFV